jgi:hypothetical protein
MTPISRPAHHSTTAGGHRSRPAALSSARQARIQVISEGVVASYIHDISARTAPSASSAISRRHGSQVHRRATRPAHARAALRWREARPGDLVRAPLEA